MKKKWHPSTKRVEYLSTFSIVKLKSLSGTRKQVPTLANCVACYRSYQDLRESFPGKPVFLPPPPIIVT